MPMKKEFSFNTLMHETYDDDDKGTSEISSKAVHAVMDQVEKSFPGALPTHRMINKVAMMLSESQKKNMFLTTCLCSDEVCRDLEDELRAKFQIQHSCLGGLAGFPFGGMAAFGEMAHHIPLNSDCLIVYGPHVGVDYDGVLGKVNRRGHHGSGACCGPANAALEYVKQVRAGERGEAEHPQDIIESQQTWVMKELLPYGERLEKADDPSAELPLALYDCQDKIMKRILQKGSGQVDAASKIVLLGGIQINTPEGSSEYFLPKKFEVVDNQGKLLTDFLPELLLTNEPMPSRSKTAGIGSTRYG